MKLTEVSLIALVTDQGMTPSRSEARRLIQQGGVAVDGEKIGDQCSVGRLVECDPEGIVIIFTQVDMALACRVSDLPRP